MADKTAPLWMPLNVADYHKDTQHLSTLEHGAYFLLLMHCWTTGGALPGDEKRLARIARLSPREWKQSREVLLDFFKLKNGEFRHKRIDAELAKADDLIEQKREAGRKSAAARAERAFNGRSTAGATGTPTEGQREANQSQSQVQESKSPTSSTRPGPEMPDDLRQVMEAGEYISIPGDLGMLRRWYDAGATLDDDILPVIRRVRQTLSKAPFTLKVFDGAIREKLARDAAEIEHLRKVQRRNAPEGQPQAAR